jgi:hypothetical protein
MPIWHSISKKMVKHYIYVLTPLVAPNLALEHGISYSHVGESP